MYEELIKRLTACEDDCSRCPMMYDEQVERDLVREHCAAYEAADAIEELSSMVEVDPNLPEIKRHEQPPTNSDRIRAMTDEELAKEVLCGERWFDEKKALKWLKAPVEQEVAERT